MPTTPETAAMSTAARQNRIEMAVRLDIAPAKAPARPPTSLVAGVANGARVNRGRRADASPGGARRLVERERTLRKRDPL
jgi:hypothetical protein